jgi:hypothetical protein
LTDLKVVIFQTENLLTDFPNVWDSCKPNSPLNPNLKKLIKEISTFVGDIYDAWQYLARSIPEWTPTGVVDGQECLNNATKVLTEITGFHHFSDVFELIEHLSEVTEDVRDSFVSCRNLYNEQIFQLKNESDAIKSCENGIVLFIRSALALNINSFANIPNTIVTFSGIIASGVNTASKRCKATLAQNFTTIFNDLIQIFGSQNECAGYVRDIIVNLHEAFHDFKNPDMMKLITVISKAQEFWNKCALRKNFSEFTTKATMM